MPKALKMPRTPARCPVCGAPDVRRIVYGLPGPDLAEAAVRGEVVLGGCMPSGRSWASARCKHAWGGEMQNARSRLVVRPTN